MFVPTEYFFFSSLLILNSLRNGTISAPSIVFLEPYKVKFRNRYQLFPFGGSKFHFHIYGTREKVNQNLDTQLAIGEGSAAFIKGMALLWYYFFLTHTSIEN